MVKKRRHVATVVIIGAGLTGLSTAYHLERQNFFDYEIYEKNDRPGGLLQSITQDGFTFDYTGHYLHINHPAFHSFLSTIANISQFDYVTRNAAIYSHEIFTAYPFQMNLHGLPANIIYDCLYGYIHRSQSRKKPQNFYEWVMKYFGKGLGNHFFFPYNSKLLAYPVKKIHPAWTGRFVPQTNLEAILRGALEKKAPQNVGYNSGFYYPKTGGIEFLIKKLTQSLSKKIITNHHTTTIDQHSKTIHFENGNKTQYQILVTTAPLNSTLASLNTSPRSTLSTVHTKLICNSVINFNLGFSSADINPYHWVYFPEKKYSFYRLGFWHNISQSLVPQKHSALYGELSYQPAQQKFSTMQKKLDQVVEETLAFLKLKPKDIATHVTLKLDHAYVIYDTWQQKNIGKILNTLEEQCIYSTGRFGHWKYSSMQEAFLDGQEAARKALASLPITPHLSVVPAKKTVIEQPHAISGQRKVAPLSEHIKE